MFPNPKSNFDELRWVIQIRKTLDEEHEDEMEIPVTIFAVPKTLVSIDPDSYTPQQVAIGPYHYWRTELYEMERYKLGSTKRTQKNLQAANFQKFLDEMIKLEPCIRACYHKYLDFNGETLAWMMAIDACFLFEFLQTYAVKDDNVLTRVSLNISHVVDFARRKSTHNVITRDVLMLENQIPLFVLKKLSEFYFSSSLELAEERLFSMLLGLCQDVSPFKIVRGIKRIDCAHLLDFLYYMILHEWEGQRLSDVIEGEDQNDTMQEETETFCNSGYVKALFAHVRKMVSKLRILQRVLLSKPAKLLVKFPWTIISNVPVFSILKQPVEYLFFSQESDGIKHENDITNNQSPLMEEITIPSVTELARSGVTFIPTYGGISTVTFDVKSRTFYLPTVNIDVNTCIILRNLVAYEAANASGPMVFTRYIELMNGIIDTAEDAELLRERGIVLNRLKNDEEVANLWNGMTKSLRLTKVALFDKVIEDVNKYYNGRWKVKARKFFTLYVFGSWRSLTLLVAVMILLLMSLQAFCTIYNCSWVSRHCSQLS